MKTPLVSVVMPYFKKINFFEQAYYSVQNQTYKNFEIIIIYDDPYKKDLENLKKIVKKKNTKIIINKKNLGAGASRNKGIKIAKGQYIAFIDSDDIWMKEKTKLQIKFMIENNYNFSHTTYSVIDKNKKFLGIRKAKNKLSFNNLLNSCDIGLSTVIINKKILKKLKFPTIRTKEDFVLWLNISKKHEIIGLNKNLASWRKLDNSLSSNLKQKLIDGFRVYYSYMSFGLIKSFYYLISLSFNFVLKNYNQKK